MHQPTLISVSDDALTNSGLHPSGNPLDAPLWRDGRNVIFKAGGPERIKGWTGAGSLSTVTGANQLRGHMLALQGTDGVQRLFFGDHDTLWRSDAFGNENTLKSGLSGQVNETSSAPATAWSMARFGNHAYMTNGVDTPQVWTSGGSSADINASAPSTAEIVVTTDAYVILMDTSNGLDQVEWCDTDDPTTWTASSSNNAGSLTMRNLQGGIKAAVNFGEQIAVFGKDQLYMVFPNPGSVFGYRPVLQGIGAVSKMAVVNANNLLYGVSDGGIWVSDGRSYQYIDRPIRQFLDEQWNTDQKTKTWAAYDSDEQQVLFGIPTSGGEPTLTLSYRPENQTWSIYDYGRTAVVPNDNTFENPIFAEGNSVYQHNDADSTEAFTAYVQSRPLQLGPEDDAQVAAAQKYIEAMALRINRLAGTVQARIGTQQHTDDAVTWQTLQTLDDGFEPLYFRTSGRHAVVYVQSTAASTDWVLTGFDISGRIGGRGT